MAQDAHADPARTPQTPAGPVPEPKPLAARPEVEVEPNPEPKPDSLALLAIDANALAHAIRAGQGTDVSRLVSDLLRGRAA